MSYNPSFAPPVQTGAPAGSNKNWMAIVSLVVGIINLCAWFIPFCGCPLSIVGIVFGILGMKSSQRTMAIIGIVLSSLGLIASLINGIMGAVTGSGTYTQLLQQFMPTP